MDSFFIEYRDPMFGIILLLTLVFIIAFVNYWWGIFKTKEEKHSIEQFIKRFEIVADENETVKLLDEFGVPSESLGLLAHSYTKSGDFEKAINIYLLALKRVKKREEKQYILTELGKTYFKAGFLRRCSEVFLEALRLYPRNKVALKYMTVSYEKLKEYTSALDVLDALEELEVDVSMQKAYIRAKQKILDKDISNTQKIDAIKEIKDEFPLSDRMLLEFWQSKDIEIDSKELSNFNVKHVIDLLWYMPKDVLQEKDLNTPLLKALAKAKGLHVEIDDSGNFELEVLGKLQEIDYNKATLNFEYFCNNCKQTFPVHFYRCPNCHTLGSVSIELNIVEAKDETSLPF